MTATVPIAATARGSADVVLELCHLGSAGESEPVDGAELDQVVTVIADLLAGSGRTLEVRLVHLDDVEAARLGVVRSPTVRVNGVEAYLGAGDGGFVWRGTRSDRPPAGLIVEAVLRQLDIETVRRRHAGESDDEPERRSGPVADLAALRSALRGAVLEPGDAGWGKARGTYNLVLDQQPALVVVPADAGDVVTVVEYARRRHLQVVPQRSGHNAEPLGSLEHTILLRTDAMRWVRIDTDRRLAVVGAGAKWEDVVPEASRLGLAALHGSTPDVSVAGYSMGGGVGWYARAHGLAANSVTGLQVVTADGHLRWVDHDNDAELFWALRGGGGNFGVVTAVEFRLYPVAEVYAGVLFFPWERSAEVLHAWHEWTGSVPEEVTSVGRMIQFPPTEDVPEPLRGGSFALVEAVYLGDRAGGEALLAPLRALGPVLDTFASMPPAGIAELHMDPPLPLPYATNHQVLSDLTAAAIDELVAAVGPGSGSELISVEIRHLGGAMSRTNPWHGAIDRMTGPYLLFGVGLALDPEMAAAVTSRLAAMNASMRSVACGLYFNFTEQRVDPATLFPGAAYARLQAVRRAVDPDERFRANHAIPLE